MFQIPRKFDAGHLRNKTKVSDQTNFVSLLNFAAPSDRQSMRYFPHSYDKKPGRLDIFAH